MRLEDQARLEEKAKEMRTLDEDELEEVAKEITIDKDVDAVSLVFSRLSKVASKVEWMGLYEEEKRVSREVMRSAETLKSCFEG